MLKQFGFGCCLIWAHGFLFFFDNFWNQIMISAWFMKWRNFSTSTHYSRTQYNTHTLNCQALKVTYGDKICKFVIHRRNKACTFEMQTTWKKNDNKISNDISIMNLIANFLCEHESNIYNAHNLHTHTHE